MDENSLSSSAAMASYLKNRIWDLLLCTAISLGLVYPIFAGFVLKDRLSPNIPAVLALLAAVQFFLLLTAYGRRTKTIRVLVGAGLLVIFMAVSRRENPFIHEENMSLAVTLFILVLTGLLVFLATRTRPGTVVLFLLGFLVTAGSRFLRFPVQDWSFLLFLFSVMVMLWYRNYTLTLLQVQIGRVQIRKFMRQTLLVCLAGLVMSGAIYAGIIRPLHPPTQQLKLVTRLERMDLLKVMGVSETKTILNPDLAANAQADSSASGNKKKSTDAGNQRNQTKQADAGSDEKQETGAKSGTGRDNSQVQASRRMYYEIRRVHIPWVLIALGILAAAYYVFRVLNRKHWEKQVRDLEDADRIVNYYQFFLRSFSKCGFQKPENYTLSEYAQSIEHELQVFAEGKSTFSGLTEIYCRTVYGRQQLKRKDVRLFVKFYEGFRKNLRKEIGTFRYLWQYYFQTLV